MSRLTDEDLRIFFRSQPIDVFHITGLVDSGDALYLGQVAIDHARPSWGFGMWGGLSDTARFYMHALDAEATGVTGFAIIFRQFDHSRFSDEPSEMFAGWVRSEQALEAEGWITEMNARIAAHLHQDDPGAGSGGQ